MPWSIGNSSFRDRTWNGLVDEVQTFNRALSQIEIQAVFDAAQAGECKGAGTVQGFTTNLGLATGATNTLDLGILQPGVYSFEVSGNGDLVSSDYQTKADGSLFAPGVGAYSFTNPGASYPALFGGDGINHFVDGGATYDFSGSGFPFAGPRTTDTTRSDAIRFGAAVGTFSHTPALADWFQIGTGRHITISGTGTHLYLAVNDSVNSDNHGSYVVNYNYITGAQALIDRVQATQNSNGTMSISIIGANFPSDVRVALVGSGPSIAAINIVVSTAGDTITGMFDLTNAAVGTYAIVLTKSDGTLLVSDPAAFNILQ